MKLKPCPFCGGEAKYSHDDILSELEDAECGSVACKSCQAGCAYTFKAEAVAAWETRAGEDEG